MGAASQTLDATGIDAVCGAIGEGKSLTAIAEREGVSLGSLLTWIEADPERSARAREARTMMARYWDERSEQVIEAAGDEFSLKKAKELSHHYRWRAAKIAPREYGERVQHANDPDNPMPSSITVTLVKPD
jgi:hypothetical protein